MLTLDRVSKVYRVGTFGTQPLNAVRDVSLTVPPGVVVSLIGESGSGKSTIGRMVLRLTPVTSGAIAFDGRDVAGLSGHRARKGYYRHVQGVFQDPFSSFNPIFPVDRVFDMLRGAYFPGLSDTEWRASVRRGTERVGLDPGQVLGRYPHQLSGGQLQRLLIARALTLDIRLLVADEIISMLDASTRIDVLNLLGDLRAEGLGILFVTHDLALGTYVSDTTVILRRGAVAEMGPTRQVYASPRHPYTRGLLASVPRMHRTWADADAELDSAAGPCPVHSGPGTAGPVEVGPDHFVGCFSDDACPE
ncbi:ABC transporter ATP-binding protein [Nocardiopsis suaedae]|uniref:ABC transporter ATP-binding protein n=1 Tax=Nocardiopsis suaedae TaxID=3018444 RepID=A0ABT4TH76_9ACTN|nr:ABC transporter ATP-binding protein [Nocardiopsis suaedae]MDA2803427.1 ABC transporter ATP-binding protein [Nocardiopsis suaedae]